MGRRRCCHQCERSEAQGKHKRCAQPSGCPRSGPSTNQGQQVRDAMDLPRKNDAPECPTRHDRSPRRGSTAPVISGRTQRRRFLEARVRGHDDQGRTHGTRARSSRKAPSFSLVHKMAAFPPLRTHSPTWCAARPFAISTLVGRAASLAAKREGRRTRRPGFRKSARMRAQGPMCITCFSEDDARGGGNGGFRFAAPTLRVM